MLFLVFINDIDEGLLSQILKFADDTKIFGTATNDSDRLIIQNDLTTLAAWASDGRWSLMRLNVKLCTLEERQRDGHIK